MVLGPNEVKLSQSYVFDQVSEKLDQQLRVTGNNYVRVFWDSDLALGRAIEENSIELSEMLESAYKAAGWGFVVVTITGNTNDYGSTVLVKLTVTKEAPVPKQPSLFSRILKKIGGRL